MVSLQRCNRKLVVDFVIIDDNYIREIGKVTRKTGGLFCLDGIASGTLWTNMKDLEVDIYLTAPQKGWSSPASCGVVMLGGRALDKLETTKKYGEEQVHLWRRSFTTVPPLAEPGSEYDPNTNLVYKGIIIKY